MIDKLKKISPLGIAVIVGVLLVVLPFYGYLYLLYHPYLFQKKQPYEYRLFPSPTYSPPVTYVSPTSTIPLKYTTLNLGQPNWLQFPKTISFNPYINNSPTLADSPFGGVYFDKIKYYQTATFADGSKLINAIVPTEGMGTYYDLQRFIQTPSSQLYYIVDTDKQYNQIPTYLAPNVLLTNIIIPGIESPQTFDTDQGKFGLGSYLGNNIISFTELKNPVLMTTTPYGRLYAVYTDVTKDGNLHAPGGIFDRKFWLRLSDDTVRMYRYSPNFLTDDKIPQLTWVDDTKNTQAYSGGFKGKCGVNYGSVIKENSVVTKSLSPVGTTRAGEPIYAISDPVSPVLDDIYNSLDPSVRPDKSTFLLQKNHFLYRDKFGDWLLYISELNQIQAECGKPVIYLYPPKDAQVSVKVGANITKSEPEYPVDGWTVFAHSNGQLDYQNKTYPNLFWEGTGFGFYNSHGGEGFVVPQEKLVSTILGQLKQQGLNAQESADFMAFWQPKLPATPYVRLTWLNTADMNQLAPLQVSPKPNTVIRLFLEFEGLEKPISLKPQKLQALPRQGFTLVEWGGLLRK